MADRRIRIPKDKVDLVEALCESSRGKQVFSSLAEVLAFAAALGASRKFGVPFQETAKDPIRLEVFNRHGHDTLINLLAVYHEDDAAVLSNTEEMEERRALIFEEYANGGLQVLRKELAVSGDYLKDILLLIQKERERPDSSATGLIDLNDFME